MRNVGETPANPEPSFPIKLWLRWPEKVNKNIMTEFAFMSFLRWQIIIRWERSVVEIMSMLDDLEKCFKQKSDTDWMLVERIRARARICTRWSGPLDFRRPQGSAKQPVVPRQHPKRAEQAPIRSLRRCLQVPAHTWRRWPTSRCPTFAARECSGH